LPAIIIVAALFVVFDIYLTKQGVWGFNQKYLIGLHILGLPIEEWLFFIVIPYASLFLHYSFILYFPKFELSLRNSIYISLSLAILCIIFMFWFSNNSYTFYIALKTLVAIILVVMFKPEIMQKFAITFLLILVPFLLVNGILTGSFIENEVVWYNSSEIVGIRIFTIPLEDFAYGFTMILLNLFLIERILKKSKI